MNKMILTQVLTENGKVIFDGLHDKDCLPVRVALERDDNGIVMSILRSKEISQEDFDRICLAHPDDCSRCPIDYCCSGEDDESEEDDDE